MPHLAKKIIQVLLHEGSSVKKVEIARFLKFNKNEIEESLNEIRNLLAVLDLNLIETESSLEIALSEDISNMISIQRVNELRNDLSESALQTLSVVLYKDKATKPEIDFIRGVDSARSIKSLTSRGIIEKINEKNRNYYIPSTETLKYLGLGSVNDLSGQAQVSTRLKTLIEGE